MINKQLFLETYNYFDKEVIVEIIDIFIAEYSDRIEKLYNDSKEANFKDLKFDSHGIKGVIANFYAPKAWEQARDMEKMASEFLASNGEGYIELEMIQSVQVLEKYVLVMVDQLKEIKQELISN